MYNANDLIKTIKHAAIEAVDSTKPVKITFGEVISTSPLKIKVEQKLVLEKEQLILSRNVTNYKTTILLNFNTDNVTLNFENTHNHTIKGNTGKNEEHFHDISITSSEKNITFSNTHNHSVNKEITVEIKNGLQEKDEVILLRMQEGQKYIVLDRVGD